MAAALSDGAEETAAGGEVLLIGGEVGREVQDALGEGGGLVIGASGILVVELVVLEVDVLIDGDAAHVFWFAFKFGQREHFALTAPSRPSGRR